jgi:Tol biopolymer transport system component/uncharacterized protein YjdB
MSRLSFRSLRAAATRRALHLQVALVVAFLTLACGDDGVRPSPAPAVAEVVVQPGVHSLVEGDQMAYDARVLDASGAEIPGSTVEWSSTTPDVASVSPSGLVTAHTVGSTIIRAVVRDKVGSGELAVVQAPVSSVELDAAEATLAEGETRQLQAVAKDAAGRVLTDRAVTWASGDASVVTVDSAGQLTAVRIGQADVTATVEGRAATARITVTRAPAASVTISPAGFVLEIGEERQMQAVVRDARGNVLPGRQVQWAVDNATATITPTGLLTGARHGYVTITATSEGATAGAGATIIDAVPLPYDLVYYRMTAGSNSELFVLEPGSGKAPVRLNAGTVSRTPTPSPDGSRVAFAVSMDVLGTGEQIDDIFAVDVNGLNMKRLTTAVGYDGSPAWSPTAPRIAYQHWELDGRSDIWVMNADGSAPVNLTPDMSAAGFRSAPAWTRDGTRLAFAQVENGAAGSTASIWSMRADGSDKRQLTSTLTGFDASPTWSPDGVHLAFVRYYAGEADITILDTSNGALTRVPFDGLEANPAWSPDGDLIAFTHVGTRNIYTMRPNGSHVRLRTVDPAWGGGYGAAWITRQ